MNSQSIKRFWAKVKKNEKCWLWIASKREKGYGAFVWIDVHGKYVQGRAHRFSYELHIGEIPENQCVLHRCDNPPCVNPDHLFLGSRRDNNADMCKKQRHRHGTSKTPKELCFYKRGDNHHAYKFSDEIKKTNAKRQTTGGFFWENIQKI